MIQDNVKSSSNKFCANCNEKFPENAIFCPRCGNTLKEFFKETVSYEQSVLRIVWQGGIAPTGSFCITIKIDGVEEYVLNYNSSIDINITTGIHTFSFSYGKSSSLNGTLSVTGNSAFVLSINKYGLISVNKMLQIEPNGFIFPSFQLYKENERLSKGRSIGSISLFLYAVGRLLAFFISALSDSLIGGYILLLTILTTLILAIIGSIYIFEGNKEVNTKHDSNFPRKNFMAMATPFGTIALDLYMIIRIIANM